MTMRDAIVSCFRQYATFRGRARRREYWFFVLFTAVVNILTSSLDGAVFGTTSDDLGPLNTLATVALIVPTLAVGWRRMHDTDRHGAKYLIGLIPVVGWILVIVWASQDSRPGVNQYGPSPKGGPGYGAPQGYGPGFAQPPQGQYGQQPPQGQYGPPNPYGQDGQR